MEHGWYLGKACGDQRFAQHQGIAVYQVHRMIANQGTETLNGHSAGRNVSTPQLGWNANHLHGPRAQRVDISGVGNARHTDQHVQV